MDNRQNRFPEPDEGFPEDMDEMEDLNPALPDADEILDGLGEDFRFDPDDTLSEEQEAPYDEPDEPLPVPADEERTIAFDAGHAEGTGEPAGLTQTVAIGSETPPPPPPEDFPPDEGDAMAMPKRSPGFFRRVPKRVYHRGWGISLAYTAVTVLLCVFIAVMFLRVFNDVLAFITENRAVTITIDADDTVDDVAGKLKDAGLIKYDWLFSYVAKFEGSTGPYQEGEHTLNDNMNYMQLLSEIEVQPVARETVWVTCSTVPSAK